MLVRAYYHTYGLPAVITNCSNNYGPYQFPEKLIPVVIQSVLSRKPGAGVRRRDERARLAVCCGTRGGVVAGVHARKGQRDLHIGGHNEWANLRIVELICDLIDELAPKGVSDTCQERGNSRKLITFSRTGRGTTGAMRLTRKDQAGTGLGAAHTFEQGIRETVQWYLDHQEWVAKVKSKG